MYGDMYGDIYANKSKIIFLGDSNVGKTSIIHTYLKKMIMLQVP